MLDGDLTMTYLSEAWNYYNEMTRSVLGRLEVVRARRRDDDNGVLHQ